MRDFSVVVVGGSRSTDCLAQGRDSMPLKECGCLLSVINVVAP